MSDWENIECGYNAWEETMNFGTRCLGGLDDLHETSTLAVIQSSDGGTTTLPTIHSLVNNGSVLFSINKSLRSFQDLHCTVLSLNNTFDDIIDTFSINLNGTLLCVCLRSGLVIVFDIESEPQVLFQKIVCENNDKEQAFFIKSIPVQTRTENLTFYIINRTGKIHRITHSRLEDTSSDCSDYKYTDHLVMDLSKPILSADLLYPIMCCTNLEHVFICNLEMATFTSFNTKGLKKIYLCNTRFCLGLTDDGRLMSVCTKTGLRLTTKIKILFDDMLLIYDNNHVQILAVTKKDEIGSSDITLMSYPEYKTVFSLRLSSGIHFIVPEHIHDEIMYISEIRAGEAIKELRFQIISETAPEYRLQRLLRRQKFKEAEQFAKMFSLDLTEIQKAKARLIVDKYECNETDVTELLEILNGISDDEFKISSCLNTHSSCSNLKDVERILRYMNSVSPSELSADSEQWENIGPELMFRFHTFLMLVNAGYLESSSEDWNHFSICDLLSQLRILLEEGQIEEFKILYNRLDAATVEKLNQTDIATILDNVNKLALGDQESFLSAFVPLSISYLPSSVTTFIQWIISNVYYIEKTYFDAFPKNALTFLNQMVVLLKLDSIHQLDFQQCSMIDSDLLQDLENIIDTLKKLEVLKTEHRIVIPLQHLQQDMKTLFPGLLISFAKNETFLTQFIENFVQPHQNDVFGDIIEDLVKYPEEYWIKVIPIMLEYLTSLTKRLNAVIIVIKEAHVPWCEEIRKIASSSIRHNHPLVSQIIGKIQEERKSSILRKKPYCIMKPYEDSSKFILFAINRILYCNEPSMVHDIYEICKDSATTKLEADVLIIHHLIKKGDFYNALEVLDRNSEEYVSKLCRRLVMHASTAIDNEYKLDSVQENYYEILGSIFVRLQRNESSFKKQNHCNTLQLLRNVYHIQRSFKMNVICKDFIKPVKKYLLSKLMPVLTEEYSNNKNTVVCVRSCEKMAEYLKLDSKDVLIELCRQIIGDYNIIVSAGQVLYKNEDDPKSLCAMATLLLLCIGIPNSRFEISDANRWCDYEHIDLKPFTVGLRLARKLMVKAILTASEVDLIRCMEIANWTEMTYFVSYPEIHNESLHNVCLSNAMTASLSLFNGIKTVFKFYVQHLDMTTNSHMSNLYIETNGDIGKLELIKKENKQNIKSICKVLLFFLNFMVASQLLLDNNC
ncbi:hypothetical protein PPYR_07754 [Photinus pyralis]|uniref:RZZ complex subunit KNTC1/ROD C-terminal domain-containing protein n=1 Tax=Photinus pyralis TaxID=7054 RepID=A0A5N4ARC0_PHOPY|nr:hypothetical protein PPYR_07754 [Photinus pyralis]